ncbi:hypothetical protein NPIL_172991 [Nephila pilipes]|uniref:RING-type domain-containing protein n=1 Tax=Nephila pilipes TaxID=299642 RepID=A0A8X6TC70_NEPPI|nr:hypothetical protein NPIL_172991 [Nephila pilipes]
MFSNSRHYDFITVVHDFREYDYLIDDVNMYTDDDPENQISRLFNNETYLSRSSSFTIIARSLSLNDLENNISRSSSIIDISVPFNTDNSENSISRSLSLNDLENISRSSPLNNQDDFIFRSWLVTNLENEMSRQIEEFYSTSSDFSRSSSLDSLDLEPASPPLTMYDYIYNRMSLIPEGLDDYIRMYGYNMQQYMSDIDDLKITKEFLNNECSICLDKFKLNEDAKKLLCKHIFHSNCITPWLKGHDTCPVCRYEIE